MTDPLNFNPYASVPMELPDPCDALSEVLSYSLQILRQGSQAAPHEARLETLLIIRNALGTDVHQILGRQYDSTRFHKNKWAVMALRDALGSYLYQWMTENKDLNVEYHFCMTEVSRIGSALHFVLEEGYHPQQAVHLIYGRSYLEPVYNINVQKAKPAVP